MWTKAADDRSSTGGSGLREQEWAGLSTEQSENRAAHEEVSHNGSEVLQDDPDLEDDNRDIWNDVQDRPWDDDERFGPTSC